MNELLGQVLLVIAPLATASGLLYVLAAIDPRTDPQTDRGRSA